MQINEEQIKLCAKYIWQNYKYEIIIGLVFGMTFYNSVSNSIEIIKLKERMDENGF